MHFALYRNFAFFQYPLISVAFILRKNIIRKKNISEKNWSILHKSAHQFINYHLLGCLKSDDETEVDWKVGKCLQKKCPSFVLKKWT